MSKEKQHYSPDEVIIKLKKLIKHIERIQSDMDSNEITHAQARIIFPIIRDGMGYTIQELADIGGVTKGLVSRTIADLETKGFVQREKKSIDQDRNYKIILALKGQEFLTKKKIQVQEVTNQWKGKLTHEDLATFMRVLTIMTDAY